MPSKEQVAKLTAFVEAQARAGQPFPSYPAIAQALSLPGPAQARTLVRHAEQAEAFYLLHYPTKFLQAFAKDNSWRTLGPTGQSVAGRRCAKCRRMFLPESQFIFRCKMCHALDSWEFTHV